MDLGTVTIIHVDKRDDISKNTRVKFFLLVLIFVIFK